MSDILDPINQDFVKKLSQGPSLHEKTPQEARDIVETLQKHTPAADISQAKIDIPFDGREVQTVIFKPKIAQGTLPVIFYTHGGGWILGSPTVHGSLMEDLARQTGAAVVFPYYTPAPERQYPVQFEESYAVLQYIVEHANELHLKTDKIAFSGDSVGVPGHMAIAMVQLAHERKLPVNIAHLVLLYPVTDTHAKSETYKTYMNGPYLTEKMMDWMIDAFLPNVADRRNPLTSPLAFVPDEKLAKFPPTTIFVSGADPLLGEGQAFGQRLQKAGVETAILRADSQIHDFVMLEAIRHTATARAVVELASRKIKRSLE
ncbi:hypothetical protein ETB97_002470 [Aspergillus alliaceus]|uniref:Alpha/beta hydrolase fold-3 domain-containing protein n=1 Tax=Petromyces alliaceus TaxID=209559 RepID=A0A8H5ZZA0_PETAA|nr:hypothetical protein ETB97_002470 [Aspergillus burnettii]